MALTNAYCAVQDVRDEFGDSSSKLSADLIERAISAASRAIDLYTGRRFWQDAAPVARRYRAVDPYTVDIDDLSTMTGLSIAAGTGTGTYPTTWTAGDYDLYPLNADADGSGAYAWWTIVGVGSQTFTVSRATTVQVTGRFGWSAIPDPVHKACVLRSVALFKRREAPFGVAGFNDFGAVRISRRDPDVIDLLHNYVKITVGVV